MQRLGRLSRPRGEEKHRREEGELKSESERTLSDLFMAYLRQYVGF